MHRSHVPGVTSGCVSVALVAVAAAVSATVAVPTFASATTTNAPAKSALAQAASPLPPRQERQGAVPGQILVTLDAKTSVTGSAIPGTRLAARLPHTSDAGLNARLRSAGALSLRPLLPALTPASVNGLTSAARSRLGSTAADVSRTYVLQTTQKDSAASRGGGAVPSRGAGCRQSLLDWMSKAMVAPPTARGSVSSMSARIWLNRSSRVRPRDGVMVPW